ncbi:tyrosine-protein phosphatase [Halioxenophilus sp. WMMB6]|uniref:tyrosine-protein phosphatase n=1 Tax=Halioxenophilus sp. WMMB6 TaxID=3073815 RepID=UPI00295E222B|nr:tyrosine-protein phosphatase [Halioxenophilus sp. WMMB6]
MLITHSSSPHPTHRARRRLTLFAGILFGLSALFAKADIDSALQLQSKTSVTTSYQRALPLAGGSNFRDLGGYPTVDGQVVRKGLLFRSAVMTNLTEADKGYLAQFGFDTVVDLRSNEERTLFPDSWLAETGINYQTFDYSFAEMLKQAQLGGDTRKHDMGDSYRHMPYAIIPQLKAYFAHAINGDAPLVVHCTGGQDRTGISSALLLTALGVSRANVVQDYVATPIYRNPAVELTGVDLAAHADSNAFAKLLLTYGSQIRQFPTPVFTDEGVPYLYYAFAQIEQDYGSVPAFLDKALGVSAEDIATLRALYLVGK